MVDQEFAKQVAGYLTESLGEMEPRLLISSATTLAILLYVLYTQLLQRPSRAVRVKAINDTPGTVRVSALWIFPVKSCKGIQVEAVKVTDAGAENDREWVVVKMLDEPNPETGENCKFITGREKPALMRVQPSFADSGNLRLTLTDNGFATTTRVEVLPSDAKPQELRRYKHWTIMTEAEDQGDRAAKFFCEVCGGEGYRLLRMEKGARVLASCEKYGAIVPGGDRSKVGRFQDWSPFSVGSEPSLGWLNQRLEAPVPMSRFRPNIVVSGAGGKLEPFDEETWGTLKIGQVVMQNVRCTGRCVMTTLRPEHNGARDDLGEPLRTLKLLRAGTYPFLTSKSPHFSPENFFCCNLVHEYVPGQEIRVGDPVTVAETKEPYMSSHDNFPLLMTKGANPYKRS